MRSLILPCVLLLTFHFSIGQQASTFKEYRKVFTTYPFSDPDPVPSQAAIYPYFRYDGFTNTSIQKEWKVVELENDYIRVLILPEIGGKIWTAIEKSGNRPYIYNNQVVKFRDVAMRGPWTSGGLEPNYGIIGHTPNCATPVDYIVRSNPDKSVSCIMMVLDLLTRTRWQLEVNLPFDKAFFTTRSFWYNPTDLEQPYYHWMNTGIKVKGNLEFIYPGTHYLGHGGEYADWPVNKENGKQINLYEQNDFGTYKSYHVFGKYTDFFGAYWHDDEMGMVRYAPQDEKAGKKIWIWGLSRQGMIWEKILTDHDGQYAEIQSGRLFNQNAEQSTFTPFKHRSFAPQATDRWTEYWYPVLHTRGMKVANDYASLNVIRENGWIKWYCSPVQRFSDTVKLYVNGMLTYKKAVEALPLQLLSDSVKESGRESALAAEIPGIHLQWDADPGFNALKRPLETPASFDWNSAYGLYVQGKEDMDQKLFMSAAEKLARSLEKGPYYLPALVKMAELHYRNGRFSDAFSFSQKALAIDNHDGAANYYFGLAALESGDRVNAKDGLGIASLSSEYRSAAYAKLAVIYLQDNDLQRALHYAELALDFNRYAVNAMETRAIAYRKMGDRRTAEWILSEMEQQLPLSPFVRFERGLWDPSRQPGPQAFDKSELPQEIWLELATGYVQRGCLEEARACLELAGNYPLPLYWKAYLHAQNGRAYQEILNQADRLSSSMVFPFRVEMIPVLRWAVSVTDSWKPRYYLALVLNDKGQRDEALGLLRSLSDRPDAAPFYALRALWSKDDPASAEKDLIHAVSMDTTEWRYPKLLAQHYIAQKDHARALTVAGTYDRQHPGSYIMQMLHVKTLLLTRQYAACDALLAKMDIIPFEGATEGRGFYWEAKLMQALEHMEKGQFKKALAFIDAASEWPENLGVGKPYDADIDSRLENWLRFECYSRSRNEAAATKALDAVVAFKPGIYNTIMNFQPANHLVTAWALERSGNRQQAIEWLQEQQKKFPQLPQLKWASDAYLQQQAVETDLEDAGIRLLRRLARFRGK